MGDDSAAFSDNLTLGTSVAINEGGFINLDTPLTGRYVVIRRIGPALLGADGNYYTMNEIKLYEGTNLLNYGA